MEPQYQNQLSDANIPPAKFKKVFPSKVLVYFIYGLVATFILSGCILTGFLFGFSQGLSDKANLDDSLVLCQKQLKEKMSPTPTLTPKPEVLFTYSDEKNNFVIKYPPNWEIQKEADGPKFSTASSQLKFWVGLDKKYTPTATESAKIVSTENIILEVDGRQFEAKKYTFTDGKLFLFVQLSDNPKVSVWFSSSPKKPYEDGLKIIQSFKFQRSSPF